MANNGVWFSPPINIEKNHKYNSDFFLLYVSPSFVSMSIGPFKCHQFHKLNWFNIFADAQTVRYSSSSYKIDYDAQA